MRILPSLVLRGGNGNRACRQGRSVPMSCPACPDCTPLQHTQLHTESKTLSACDTGVCAHYWSRAAGRCGVSGDLGRQTIRPGPGRAAAGRGGCVLPSGWPNPGESRCVGTGTAGSATPAKCSCMLTGRPAAGSPHAPSSATQSPRMVRLPHARCALRVPVPVSALAASLHCELIKISIQLIYDNVIVEGCPYHLGTTVRGAVASPASKRGQRYVIDRLLKQ